MSRRPKILLSSIMLFIAIMMVCAAYIPDKDTAGKVILGVGILIAGALYMMWPELKEKKNDPIRAEYERRKRARRNTR